VCQGLYYLPNALATVMYPRFQERYGQTQSSDSLRMFVELQLHVLADVLLAAVAVLLVALPPAIAAFFPQYVETIAPLRVMLVATYFVALAPPAGQFLLTIRKQTPALLVALPATALAVAAGYIGSSFGLVGVAVGIAFACLAEFLAINAYALSHFSRPLAIAAQLGAICGTAAAWLVAAVAINRFVPAGPPAIAVVGGWRLLVVGLLSLPLLLRAARRIHALQRPDS
jgi:O-antigen/teichoic acid export membrane protein